MGLSPLPFREETKVSVIKSKQALRAKMAKEVSEIVITGCVKCGHATLLLKYGNGGYGEPWWEGYCRNHMTLVNKH